MTINKVALVYIKNRKLLLGRSSEKDTFYTIGGKIEEGETKEEALVREVKEEINVDVKVETIKFLETFDAVAHGKAEGTILMLNCYTAEIVGEPNPSSEIEELGYFDSGALGNVKMGDGAVQLIGYLKAKNLID